MPPPKRNYRGRQVSFWIKLDARRVQVRIRINQVPDGVGLVAGMTATSRSAPLTDFELSKARAISATSESLEKRNMERFAATLVKKYPATLVISSGRERTLA
jgi:hypothetical protein